jgi:tetratricopeptide (TPR) repeat protein
MSIYVWAAKDKFGTSAVKEVPAETIEASKTILLLQGYADLVLMKDEVSAAVDEAMPKTIKSMGRTITITEADKLKWCDKPEATFLNAIPRRLKSSRDLLIIFAFAAASCLYYGHKLILLPAFALLVWMLFLIYVQLTSIYFAKLHRAADWYRWQRVLKIIAILKFIEKFSSVKVPATELARCRAKALAGLGRLPEALAEFAPCENQPGCPSWLYKAQLAGICDIAKQHDQGIEYTKLSIAEKPTPAVYLDLANRYARHKSDPLLARQAMAEAEKSTLTEIAVIFQHRCRGIIHFLEHNYPAAQADLEAALAIIHTKHLLPYRDGLVSIARAYLGLTQARQGNLTDAKKNFAAAKKYLIATGEKTFLEMCQKEIFNRA